MIFIYAKKYNLCLGRQKLYLSWRRRRDLNSRAGLNPTYTLSRGASSANLSTSPN